MSSNRKSDICYRCGKPAVSKEHVPPLCLFPELKDQPDSNRRVNLITVPSCDEHNAKKSKDDEFLLITLPSVVGNNSIGYIHTKTKLRRALKRIPKEIFEQVIVKNLKNYRVDIDADARFDISIATPDYARFIKCFENIAAGLYYHEFGSVFRGEIFMHLGFVNYKEKDRNTFVSFLREKFIQETGAAPLKGDNHEVFVYGFSPIEENGMKCLKLLFYESADVYVAFLPEGSHRPISLAEELIRQGIMTVITLGDKEYKFNHSKETVEK